MAIFSVWVTIGVGLCTRFELLNPDGGTDVVEAVAEEHICFGEAPESAF